MAKKLTARQLQAMETKQKIHDKALELFSQTDFEHVSTTDICKALNMAVGNFYRYYASKEELIMESYPSFDKYVETEFRFIHFANYVDAIKHLIFRQTMVAQKMGVKIYAQVLRIQVKSEGKHVIEEKRAFHTYLRELVKGALNNKEIITDYSADEISSLVLHTSRGVLLEWAMQNEPYSVSERAVYEVEMILNFIKKHDEKKV